MCYWSDGDGGGGTGWLKRTRTDELDDGRFCVYGNRVERLPVGGGAQEVKLLKVKIVP